MSDWRDTFERFHEICNQEEARMRGMNDETVDLDAVQKRWDEWYGRGGYDESASWCEGESMEHHITSNDVPALVAEVKRLRDKWEAPRPHVAHRMPGDPAVLRSCRECYPLPTGPADRIGAKLDADVPVTDRFDGTAYAWAADQPIGVPQPGVPQPGNAPYTPNTEQVRAAYVRAMRNAFIASAGEHEAEFTRWLHATITEAVALDREGRA